MNNVYLLKAALNAARKQRGLPEVDAFEFLALVREKMKLMHMDDSFLSRGVNEGFSGGEKKRNEILQMLVLEPRLAILDETDSGLDIDALKVVADGRQHRCARRSAPCVLVTHYQRLLDYVVPDFVHVLVRGRIARSGDRALALELERRGYDWVDRRGGLTAVHERCPHPPSSPRTTRPAPRARCRRRGPAHAGARAIEALSGARPADARATRTGSTPTCARSSALRFVPGRAAATAISCRRSCRRRVSGFARYVFVDGQFAAGAVRARRGGQRVRSLAAAAAAAHALTAQRRATISALRC